MLVTAAIAVDVASTIMQPPAKKHVYSSYFPLNNEGTRKTR